MTRLVSTHVIAALAAGVVALSGTTALATDFEGAYVGLSIGSAMGEGTHTPSGSATPYGTASTDTEVVGGVLGWNQRQGDFVYGLELGLSTGLSDGGVFNHSCACSSMQLNYQSSIELGARGGWVSGDTLFYGSVGAAYLRYEEIFTSTSAPSAISMKNNDTVPFLGLGVEHGFADGWSLRGEYRHYFGVSTSNPATVFPGSLTTLSSGARDYDLGVFAVTLTRYF